MNLLKHLYPSFLFLFISFSFALNGALILKPAEVCLRIEDVDFKKKVVASVNFAGEEIDLEESGISDYRKDVKFKLMPGIYCLKWTTQVGDIAWIPKEERTHERLIEIEKKDIVVHIKIRGDDLSLY